MPSAGNLRAKKWKANRRRKVYAQTQGLCAYCGEVAATTVDHLVPRDRGGEDDLANLRPACRDCNTRKANRLFSCQETATRWLTVTKTLGVGR